MKNFVAVLLVAMIFGGLAYFSGFPLSSASADMPATAAQPGEFPHQMRVKFFLIETLYEGGVFQKSQDEVNKWLAENRGAEIISIEQSSAGANEGNQVTHLSIFYRNK